MVVRRHKSSHVAAAAAVLAFVGLGLGIPILTSSGRLDGSLVAAPRDRFTFTEPLTIKGIPGIRIDRGTISLSEIYSTRIMSGEAVSSLLASGSARLVLEGATITIDRNVSGTSETAVEGTAPLAAALADAHFETLSIRRSTLVFVGEDGRRDEVGEVNTEVTLKRRSQVSGKGSLTVQGHKLALDATMGLVPDARTAAPATRTLPLRVALKGPMIEAQLDGKLTTGETAGIQGVGEVSIRNGRDAARWLGFSWPTGPGFSDIRIKGPVEWGRRAVAFQRATMQMDGNEAQGTLSVSFATGRPNISATLALQTLDVRGYIASWRSDARRTLIEDVMAPGPFAFPLVRHIDADLRISANRVLTSAVEFGQSAATLSLRNGKLLADIAEVVLDDARGSGQVTIDTTAAEPRFVLKGKLTSVDLSRLVPEVATGVPLQGRGDVVADISAVGQTSSDLVRTLSGKVSLAMPNGGRVGLDLKGLLASAQKQPVSGWAQSRRGVTTVDSLQGRLVLSEGVVYTEAFSAAMGDALMTATGGGNLKSGMLDVKLSLASPKGGTSPQTPVDTLTFRGPWSDPSIRVEQPPAATPPPAGLP